MNQDNTLTFKDIVVVVKRRWCWFIMPAAVIFCFSVIVLLVWKPVYRSASTILIEEQEIPCDYVMATVTSYADQRLQTINQRIMSSSRLIEIIKRFNLYADKRNRLSTDEIIDTMRKKDIKLETITANVMDKRSGNAQIATIAFSVSYEGRNPQIVQQVANELASLYLGENIKVVGQQTEGATKFIDGEMQIVKANLGALEQQIAAYKEKNPRDLPELFQYNLSTLDWSEKNYDQLNEQLRSLREKESNIMTQLSTVVPDAINQRKERLKELRVALGSLMVRFSDEHPDVIKTKAEIEELEKRLKSEGNQAAVVEKPDNPSYITLSAQLAGLQSEIKSTKQQIAELDSRRNEYRRRLEQTPRVEEGYRKLTVERNNTQAKYDDLMRKFMEAKVAHGLEKEQMGERFTLIDPARLPDGAGYS